MSRSALPVSHTEEAEERAYSHSLTHTHTHTRTGPGAPWSVCGLSRTRSTISRSGQRRDSPACVAMYFGSLCHSALPQLLRPRAGRSQAQDALRPLLPFHLLPAFSDMEPVHKALLGPSSALKRRHGSCGVCRLKFNLEAPASSHYSGTRHAKRIKALDTPDSSIGKSEPVAKETASRTQAPSPSGFDAASGEPTSPAPSSDAASSDITTADHTPCPEAKDQEEEEEEKAKRLLYCSLCKVAVNSASQLQAHNSGTKHKTMLEARSGEGVIKSFPRSGVKAKLAASSTDAPTGLQNKTFHCEICDVHVNSETQLKQHISSRRHKDRAAGKPGKPKFSPYPPGHRNQHNFQTIQMALRKSQDLTKPLTSCLLQQQISVAAAMATTMHPFPLRPTTNSAPALFQSPGLPHQALLTPGSMCSTSGPVLFTPF
uniref:C2H2-type domain-containing protein n=1 Tax=Knipowitschia caucasica TaxID=637954 RepID=A0AAV2K9S0_KNICA